METSNNSQIVAIHITKTGAYIIGLLLTIFMAMIGYFVKTNDSRIEANNVRMTILERKFDRHLEGGEKTNIEIITRLGNIEGDVKAINKMLEIKQDHKL